MSASDMLFVWVIWSLSLLLWLSNDRIEEVRLKDGTLGMDMGGGCSEKDNVACA